MAERDEGVRSLATENPDKLAEILDVLPTLAEGKVGRRAR